MKREAVLYAIIFVLAALVVWMYFSAPVDQSAEIKAAFASRDSLIRLYNMQGDSVKAMEKEIALKEQILADKEKRFHLMKIQHEKDIKSVRTITSDSTVKLFWANTDTLGH